MWIAETTMLTAEPDSGLKAAIFCVTLMLTIEELFLSMSYQKYKSLTIELEQAQSLSVSN
ncbi:MAG: hypothetical protein CMQ41_00360 [Gammaproteobacteria bacterium]|nr:hypothetical protein [Gammaproteobacteria bacterium]